MTSSIRTLQEKLERTFIKNNHSWALGEGYALSYYFPLRAIVAEPLYAIHYAPKTALFSLTQSSRLVADFPV
jgi:hypothetical protein